MSTEVKVITHMHSHYNNMQGGREKITYTGKNDGRNFISLIFQGTNIFTNKNKLFQE
jgi:hypothetical protein